MANGASVLTQETESCYLTWALHLTDHREHRSKVTWSQSLGYMEPKLDVQSEFWHVALDKSSTYLTTFNTTFVGDAYPSVSAPLLNCSSERCTSWSKECYHAQFNGKAENAIINGQTLLHQMSWVCSVRVSSPALLAKRSNGTSWYESSPNWPSLPNIASCCQNPRFSLSYLWAMI